MKDPDNSEAVRKDRFFFATIWLENAFGHGADGPTVARHRHRSPALILRRVDVGGERVLHADDVIARIDVDDFAGHAARHR